MHSLLTLGDGFIFLELFEDIHYRVSSADPVGARKIALSATDWYEHHRIFSNM